MHSWTKTALITIGCAGWLLLFPGMALAEVDLVAEFGISRSEPVDKGFFFWEGRYIEAPYVVERRGLEVFVNGIRVAEKPQGELEWPPYDYTVNEDPGDPPPGLGPVDDTPKGVDYRDTYWARKWRYLFLHYDLETARQKMREAYARSDRVADVSVHAVMPDVDVVRMKSGETRNLGDLPDEWASRGWPKPTKEEVLKAVASTQDFYKRDLDVAMVVAMSKGAEVYTSHQQALEFLQILLSDKGEEEKRRLLGEHVGLRPDNAFLKVLVRTPQASPQLARRVKQWEDEVAEKKSALVRRLKQQKDQAAEAKRQIAAIKAQARHQTMPVFSEEKAKAAPTPVNLSSSSSQPATRPVQSPASHSADGQITKIYNVKQPADEIAHWLDKILAALSGGADAPVIRSAPAAKQIIVTGSPGAHRLVEDFLPKLEREPMRPKRPPASRPATGPTTDLPPWGEEVEGLRCRLVPDQSTLKQGELPRVILYVRDQASRVLTSYFENRDDSPWVSCELELDGRWHPVQLHGRDEPDGSKILVSLGNGPPRLGWPMRLWDAIDGKQPPVLTPGTHTLRVSFTVSVSAGTGARSIRVLSNPVEIEILPAGSTDTATQPATRPAAGGSGALRNGNRKVR